ncbi:putative transposase [Limnospira platensis NIES-39]|uniref:Transposase n=3 Tax=Limnospira TaxID=2596745 RepID=A0A9P1P086_9CYAN|nr:putative transposase [Limnospira maxima CS-328]UWU47880.1 hypothetical protein APLC1_2656 [Arthrospira platensis C1]CDM96102.1 transposase [Limnospira indica PCC 8005]BAI91834.1 putative transposase [Arthrospira platensis NIES-39]GCE96958.1 putative transposase [Arthrospira platensis NIES-46]
MCEQFLKHQLNFILVCRQESHTTLHEHLDGIELPTVTTLGWTGKVEETYTYRYLNAVPLRDSDDALLVNWCELTVTTADGQVSYHNAFATNYPLSEENVAEVVLAGRTRWKVENENHNTLKTKGYNLEHNFGHGKQHLSSLLATLNILSLLFHTFLELSRGRERCRHLPLPYKTVRETFTSYGS